MVQMSKQISWSISYSQKARAEAGPTHQGTSGPEMKQAGEVCESLISHRIHVQFMVLML